MGQHPDVSLPGRTGSSGKEIEFTTMAINAPSQLPEAGQAVRVRNRLATIRAVEPYDTQGAPGRLHLVEVEYLDDCRYPEGDQLLWEVEATAKILGSTSLPGVDANRPDS